MFAGGGGGGGGGGGIGDASDIPTFTLISSGIKLINF